MVPGAMVDPDEGSSTEDAPTALLPRPGGDQVVGESSTGQRKRARRWWWLFMAIGLIVISVILTWFAGQAQQVDLMLNSWKLGLNRFLMVTRHDHNH